MAVLLLFGLTLFINLSAASAASAANSTFNTTSVSDSAGTVTSYVESNKAVPTEVTVDNQKITSAQYLYLVTSSVQKINSDDKTLTTLKSVSYPSKPTETVTSGSLSKTEYISIANKLITFINTNGRLPNYVTTSLGKIGYENLIYTYSKILVFNKNNNRLPNSITVNDITSITNTEGTNTGTNTTYRPVYIVSDNINSVTKDTARCNAIVAELNKLGITAKFFGLGPNYHNTVLQSGSVPKNALIVEMSGGACAGTIAGKSTKWYKNLVGTRDVCLIFLAGATKITGLEWLPRAWDDNFSSSTFKGLARPDLLLLNNGYNYIEGISGSDITTMVNFIVKEAMI